MTIPSLCHMFVYGTLKRGQCRERCWPHLPLRVEPAVIQAALYDLGAYPAIAQGDGLVRGELWELRQKDVQHTLRVLDEVEGFAQQGEDLFVRRVVECTLDGRRKLPAWTYYYGRVAELRDSDLIVCGANGWSSWPRSN